MIRRPSHWSFSLRKSLRCSRDRHKTIANSWIAQFCNYIVVLRRWGSAHQRNKKRRRRKTRRTVQLNPTQIGIKHDLSPRQKLDELFHDTLKDIYFAEKKIPATLPKMEKAAQAPELKRAFAKQNRNRGHVARLEKIFAAIGQETPRQNV